LSGVRFRESPIRKAFSLNELEERVSEQVWVLAVVVSERHLIEVRGKMTGAEMMILAAVVTAVALVLAVRRLGAFEFTDTD